jgi:hypothetical protein
MSNLSQDIAAIYGDDHDDMPWGVEEVLEWRRRKGQVEYKVLLPASSSTASVCTVRTRLELRSECAGPMVRQRCRRCAAMGNERIALQDRRSQFSRSCGYILGPEECRRVAHQKSATLAVADAASDVGKPAEHQGIGTGGGTGGGPRGGFCTALRVWLAFGIGRTE